MPLRAGLTDFCKAAVNYNEPLGSSPRFFRLCRLSPPIKSESHCQELATNIMSPNRLSACTNAAGTWQG